MKKVLLLFMLLISTFAFSQAEYEKIAITENVKDSLATKILVQSSTGELNYDIITEFRARPLDTLFLTNGQGIYWSSQDNTISIPSGFGNIIQVGQEYGSFVYNDTGVTLLNGKVVYPSGGNTGGNIHVEYAKADTHLTISAQLGVLTSDIAPGEIGFATVFGKVREFNTTTFTPGPIYVSATIAGDLTNIEPTFPDYSINMGGVLDSDINGTLQIKQVGNTNDDLVGFHNGTIRETFDFLVTSNGATIIGTLTPANGHPDLTMLFSDGRTMFDISGVNTVTLAPGPDDDPQDGFIYILKSNKQLAFSTAGFPADEHIKISNVTLKSAITTQAEGALVNRNHNDHIEDTGNFQGHLSHITNKIRNLPAEYVSGVDFTITINTGSNPDDVFIRTTGGEILQLHQHPFEALDIETGDDIHIVNHSATPFLTVSNLNTQILDAQGNSLNSTSFSFVVWGVINKTGEPSHLMLNLPTDSYSFNSPQDAVNDNSGFSVYTIPKSFKGTGFLIGRFTFTYKNNAWVLIDSQDLRGFLPNISAGGGGGTGGVSAFTQLLDTPNSYIGQGSKVVSVGALETALEFRVLDATDISDFDTEVSNNTSVVNNTDKTNTSDFINDGEDGINPFITAVELGDREFLIDGYWVDKKLNSNTTVIEVGDQIRGNFASDNYIIANVLSLPHTFKPNLDLFIDNYLDDFTIDFGSVNYGYLYNWFTVDDARNISNTGWSVPTKQMQKTLSDFLGGNLVASGKLKETGTIYWDSPNTDATNSSNFNGRGAGDRPHTAGSFNSINIRLTIWGEQETFGGSPDGVVMSFDFNTAFLSAYDGTITYNRDKNYGNSIRLIKDTTTLSDGETSTYTGNDGKVYRTICIGTQEWLADNLVETLYRNLDAIPEITDNTTWIGLSTGARCSYDNDESNAL